MITHEEMFILFYITCFIINFAWHPLYPVEYDITIHEESYYVYIIYLY